MATSEALSHAAKPAETATAATNMVSAAPKVSASSLKILLRNDIASTAVFLSLYTKPDRDELLRFVATTHGNAFLQKVLAYRPSPQELAIGKQSFTLAKRDFKPFGQGPTTLMEANITHTRGGSEPATTRTGSEAKSHHAAYQQGIAEEKAKPLAGGKLGKLGDLAKKVEASTQLGSTYKADWLYAHTDQFDLAGANANVSTRALHLERIGEANAGLTAEGLQVGGGAGATVTVLGTRAQIASPELSFDLFGEQVAASVSLGVDAGAFIELGGKAGLDVGKHGAGIHASLSGFAGIKGGVTAAATLMWRAKSATRYAQEIVKAGAWRPLLSHVVPARMLAGITDETAVHWIEKVLGKLLTRSGDTLVIGASARTDASAGFGGAAEMSGRFRGGVLHCHGHAGLTFGLGASAKAELIVGMTDGLALLSILAMRGLPEIGQALGVDAQPVKQLKAAAAPV